MRLLLDTHALLWALATPRKLSKKVTAALKDPRTDVFFSAASTWEIAIKTALGKLHADLDEVVTEARSLGFAELAVSVAHTLRLSALPNHHRDPFDRLIVAQAIEDDLKLVTADTNIHMYRVTIFWE